MRSAWLYSLVVALRIVETSDSTETEALGAELAAVLKANPFPEAAPNRTVAIFLNKPPPATVLAEITGQAGEEVRLGKREIYVHYRDGIGKSKLRIPAALDGTARNMNTIAKLTGLAG